MMFVEPWLVYLLKLAYKCNGLILFCHFRVSSDHDKACTRTPAPASRVPAASRQVTGIGAKSGGTSTALRRIPNSSCLRRYAEQANLLPGKERHATVQPSSLFCSGRRLEDQRGEIRQYGPGCWTTLMDCR